MSELISRITPRTAWAAAQRGDSYRAESLERDGFIHFSTPAQVAEVADALYRDRHDLVLLCALPEKLTAELRYEALGTPEPYPHLNGPLNVDAVVRVVAFAPREDGTFQRPTEVDSSLTS